MYDALEKTTGALHILINNAGFNMFKGIADTTPAEWDRIMQVDLRGIYLMTRRALPLLKKAGKSSMISIASVHAHATVPHLTAYAAAKGGVVAVTRSLCQELGPFGIRVNSISPGFTNTAIMDRWLASVPDPQETMRQVNSFHPLGRIAEPKEIGYLAAFLSSDYAAFITGVNVTIDGGLTSRLMH
jgi:NAD(P)-dependent dehydrogenase (short-subunit alcohol dehydrogenase family)